MDPEIWFQWRVDYTGNMSKKIRCKMSNEYEVDYHFFSQTSSGVQILKVGHIKLVDGA
jgi:hypothetical protein